MTTLTQHDQHGLYPTANSVEDFKRNLDNVHTRIANACKRASRPIDSVRLLPVSKTFNEDSIRLAYAAGCRLLGENKLQEAHRKWENLDDLSDLKWSIIGHLQTNKAKLVAKFATEFQALDSLRLAKELDKRLQAEGKSLDVLVQVNTSGEQSKYGLHPDELGRFLKELPSFTSLRVKGLMTLALFTQEANRVRTCFQLLKRLQIQHQQDVHASISLDELSMGMSGDYEIAIEEGATVVRVGQAIFGARQLPDEYFWPNN